MSGIFGCYHRDKQPASHALWEGLGNMTAHRGPDGTHIQSSGAVLLGHNALHTTPESLNEQLPHFSKTRGLAITADARIDNRAELLHTLDIKEELYHPLSDSRIILLAYKKWGEDSFHRILGDFAFVLWDSREQKMVCVRDSPGVKPLYYLLSERLFAFSSEIEPLITHPEASKTLNEGVVGEYLAAKTVSKTETLYTDILRLAPGHFITVNPETTSIRQYWEPNFRQQLHYPTEREYVEHFQEIFQEAVRCRIRSQLPVSLELSGGLDSSSIVGMAHTMSSTTNKKDFATCSLVYPGLSCDETHYIQDMERHLGISAHYIDVTHSPQADWCGELSRTCSVMDPPNLSNSEALLKHVQQNRSRVLLSGLGGDEWFSGSDYSYLDNFLEKRYAAIPRELGREWGRNRKTVLKKLAANFTWPLLPLSVKRAIIRKKRRHSLYPPWIATEFARRINLEERLLGEFGEPHVTDLAQADLFGLFHSGYEANVLEKNDLQKGRYQIEGRHPFLDRRIIEFALALPNSLHYQGGISKYLLRLAGKKYLPTTICNRNSKAEFSQLYYRTFSTEHFANGLKDSKLYDRGWLDRQALHDAYANNLHCFHKNPSGPCPDTLPIWFAFAISTWYSTGR